MAPTRPAPAPRRKRAPQGRARRNPGRRRRRPSRARELLRLFTALLIVAGALVGGTALLHGRHGNRANPPQNPTPTPTSSSSAAAQPASALWQATPSPAQPVLTPLMHLPATAPVPKQAGIAKQLAGPLADPAFVGDTVSVVVTDPLTKTTLLNDHGTDAVLPASTAKLAVAVAALQVLGPGHRFSTAAVLDGTDTVVLVGGGDPTLAGPKAIGSASPGFPPPARLADLAKQTASALKARGITVVQLHYDDTLFQGPSTAPGWKPTYVTEGDVAPVSALEVDEGRPDPAKPPRTNEPAELAAQEFAALLTADGVKVAGTPVAARNSGGPVLANVTSPTLAALVERMLGESDNDLAEALGRHVALATGRPPTFAGGAAAVHDTVAKSGITGFSMVDASGLSRSDRVQPRALAQLLDVILSPGHPNLAPILQGLPVAGFSGTLARRYTTAPAGAAAGVVRAKTGTLDGVVALAGYLDDASGRVLTFAVIVSGVQHGATERTESAVDRITAALAGCGCT